jgi:hypothetical protein
MSKDLINELMKGGMYELNPILDTVEVFRKLLITFCFIKF